MHSTTYTVNIDPIKEHAISKNESTAHYLKIAEKVSFRATFEKEALKTI